MSSTLQQNGLAYIMGEYMWTIVCVYLAIQLPLGILLGTILGRGTDEDNRREVKLDKLAYA